MSTVIIGRLTADPELKFVGNKGTALATFSVAVNRKKAKKKSRTTSTVLPGAALRRT
jgi:single-stranded DNA-binding protein